MEKHERIILVLIVIAMYIMGALVHEGDIIEQCAIHGKADMWRYDIICEVVKD